MNRTLFALICLVAMACDAAQAQGTGFPGKRLANGDALIAAGIESPTPEGFAEIQEICFRVRGGAELGCVARASFVVVGNGAFQAFGELHTIAETLPADAAGVNFVAVLRLPLEAGGDVLARAIDADGDENERLEPLTFRATDLIPRAPVLLRLDQLQSALDRAREEIAALTPASN